MPRGEWQVEFMVNRALIPCGGTGSRMHSITGGSSKELLEVGGVSLVERVAIECGMSGIEELLIVLAPSKMEIASRLRSSALAAQFPPHIEFAVQQKLAGLADAMRMGREFASNEPLAVALPDNLFPDTIALMQVVDCFVTGGVTSVGMVEIAARDAAMMGSTPVYEGTVDGNDFRISRIPSKGEHRGRFDTRGAASAYTGVGRWVLHPEVFDLIDQVEQELSESTELDDIPVMQRLVAAGRLTGRIITGRFLDTGLPEGFREAERIFAAGTPPALGEAEKARTRL
jgi:UTP-glucose-1-phosphate uridylyltransferase